MISPFTKLGIGATSVLGTFFISEPLVNSHSKKEIMKSNIAGVGEIWNIEMVEAVKGCSFNFVYAIKENKAYRAVEFFSKFSKEDQPKIKRRMLNAVNSYFGRCKSGVTFNFSHVESSDAFHQTFEVVN